MSQLQRKKPHEKIHGNGIADEIHDSSSAKFKLNQLRRESTWMSGKENQTKEPKITREDKLNWNQNNIKVVPFCFGCSLSFPLRQQREERRRGSVKNRRLCFSPSSSRVFCLCLNCLRCRCRKTLLRHCVSSPRSMSGVSFSIPSVEGRKEKNTRFPARRQSRPRSYTGAPPLLTLSITRFVISCCWLLSQALRLSDGSRHILCVHRFVIMCGAADTVAAASSRLQRCERVAVFALFLFLRMSGSVSARCGLSASRRTSARPNDSIRYKLRFLLAIL